VKLRASHKVDVIAPGEKVETIIDKMRAPHAGTPAAPGGDTTRGPERAPPRPPQGQGGQHPDQHGPPGNGSAPQDRPHR
jgi:hypothetical protein